MQLLREEADLARSLGFADIGVYARIKIKIVAAEEVSIAFERGGSKTIVCYSGVWKNGQQERQRAEQAYQSKSVNEPIVFWNTFGERALNP